MGNRTIIAFSNDCASAWGSEPDLGLLLTALSSSRGKGPAADAAGRIGITYVECEHADTQTLIVADGYRAEPIARVGWHRDQTGEHRDLALLQTLADRLGYRVSKKPKNKVTL